MEANVVQYIKNFSLEERSLFSETLPATAIDKLQIGPLTVPRFTNEFWTARQRQASSLHEVSYRACFKPQLPRFFINLLTREGDTVYDPFSGRGTSVIEAALLGRRIIANDVNPLSEILSRPRLFLPDVAALRERLERISHRPAVSPKIDLSMFYHPDTLDEICALREYLAARRKSRENDELDDWIQMVATNRLTGHSKGFFSVYTLPPNQALSAQRQQKINRERQQVPEYRDTHQLILRKSKSLLRNVSNSQLQKLKISAKSAIFLNTDARSTPEISDHAVHLAVTSPPFLNVVQYSNDNWLRCWFNNIPDNQVAKKITMADSVSGWSQVMHAVFLELYRVTRPGGWVAFEVGEVRKKSVKLDEVVVPLGIQAGFRCEGILVNLQKFTKTANIWGVTNNSAGTNTNRIVLFRK